MARIVVMSGSTTGMSGVGLAALADSGRADIAAFILSRGQVLNRARFLRRKIRKFLFDVGPLGLIAGSRIRAILDVAAFAPHLPNALVTAEHHGIPVHVVQAINSVETENLLRGLDARVGVSLGNGMIRPSVYSIPAHGTINVHHGAVPEYRGGPPVFWEIHDGREEVGYTIHKLDRHTDSGDVLASGSVALQYGSTLTETMRSTLLELYRSSAAALVDVVADIENLAQHARKQDRPGFNTTPTLWQFIAGARRCRRMTARRSL